MNGQTQYGRYRLMGQLVEAINDIHTSFTIFAITIMALLTIIAFKIK